MSSKSIDAIAVVIPNWNGEAEITECLDSLRNQTVSHTVIVVDNGSIDNSVAIIERDFPEVILIKNKTNLGFAGGVNTGIRYCFDKKYTYVALFNNDATADKKWLTNLQHFLKRNREVGAVTCSFLHSDKETIDSTGEQYSIWGLPFPRDRGKKTESQYEQGYIFGASGGATLYRGTALKEVGLFDEDFFAYYEDADLSFRMQLFGWKIALMPKAIAYHKQGVTSKKIPGFTVVQTFKNLPWLFIKNVPRKLIISIGIRFMLAYILMFGNAIKNGSGKYALRGLIYSLKLFPKKIRERRLIQKSKKVSSEYIYDLLWKDLPPDQSGIRKLRNFFLHR